MERMKERQRAQEAKNACWWDSDRKEGSSSRVKERVRNGKKRGDFPG
jgi:hypothetical protein